MDYLKIAQYSRYSQEYAKAMEEFFRQDRDVNYSVPLVLPQTLGNKVYLGYTYLHIAAIKHDVAATKKLINLGADLMKQGIEDGYTPLILSILYGSSKNEKTHDRMGTLSENIVAKTLLSAQIQAGNAANPKSKDGISHIHAACIANNMAAVEFFLNASVPVNESINPDSSILPGYSPLHCAARYSSVAVFEILLKHGADFLLKETSGMNVLHILIARLMDATYSKKISPIKEYYHTLYVGEIEKIEAMITLIVKTWMINDKFIDDTGITILHLISILSDESMLTEILKQNVNINIPVNSDAKWWPGWSPLHFASHFHSRSTKILLQNGAVISVKNKDGETPLDICLKRYLPQVIHSILSSKDEYKNIQFKNNTARLLDAILSMKKSNTFGTFVQKLPQINTAVPPDSIIFAGYSFLHLAVSMITHEHGEYYQIFEYPYEWSSISEAFSSGAERYENERVLKRRYMNRIDLCLQQNHSVSEKNSKGDTPIHLAIKLGQPNALKKLLSHCEDDSVNDDNLSHFHAACLVGNQDLVELLLKKGAQINKQIKAPFMWYGNGIEIDDQLETYPIYIQADSTALHMAILAGKVNIATYLIENGADLHVQDARKLTPFHQMSIFRSKTSNNLLKQVFQKVENLQDSVAFNGFSYLHVAACANDVETINKLLLHGNADIQARFDIPDAGKSLELLKRKSAWCNGLLALTPLHLAVIMDSLEAIHALIDAGADIHARSSTNSTPLQLALISANSESKSKPFIDKLKREEQKVGAIDVIGLTLLHIACAKFDLEWASMLLQNGADPNALISDVEVDEFSWKNCAPLHLLFVEANTSCKSLKTLQSMVKLLIEYGARVDLETRTNTPVHLAFYAAVKSRVHEDLPSSQTNDPHNEEPQESSDSDDESTHSERSINDSTDDESESEPEPFGNEMDADEDEESHDINDQEEKNYVDALTEPGLMSVMELLIKSQDSYLVNHTNNNGFTHFHCACASTNDAIVKKYLTCGVDINCVVDPFALVYPGYTPLHFAISFGSKTVIDLLIENGANVKAEDGSGNTPLHCATATGRIDLQLFETLLRYGADINARNIKGETPFELLLLSNVLTLELLEFFLERGCLINNAYTPRYRGIIGLAMEKSKPLDLPAIFSRITKICEMNNAIHSAVSIARTGPLTLQNYVDAIESLLQMGCDIDQKDERGLTALQVASGCFNVLGIEALLLLGAKPNTKLFEIDDTFEYPYDLGDHLEDDLINGISVLGTIALHKYKMKLVGLEVNYIDVEDADEIVSMTKMVKKTNKYCQSELIKLQDIKVTRSLTMKDLLSEWKIVVQYPSMTQMQRQVLDDFFKSNERLRQNYPNLCGLLIMQYRKIVKRMMIFEAAKDAISFLCRVPFPNLCSEGILQYFINKELETLIEAANFL